MFDSSELRDELQALKSAHTHADAVRFPQLAADQRL
jgi:hypothetical protein